MMQVCGIWIPDGDEHFAGMLAGAPQRHGAATYQVRKLDAALRLCLERRHAVDIGAHVGLWSRLLAHEFERVTAFEPVLDHIECFRRNVVAGNVHLHEIALGDRLDDVMIADGGANSGNARVSDEGHVVTIDMLDPYGLQDVDLIKIDVEGYELPVLRGAEATIRREKPVLVIEQKPGNAERYGFGQTDAVDLALSWGARLKWQRGGDYCLAWP